jgi:hypothetical protein
MWLYGITAASAMAASFYTYRTPMYSAAVSLDQIDLSQTDKMLILLDESLDLPDRYNIAYTRSNIDSLPKAFKSVKDAKALLFKRIGEKMEFSAFFPPHKGVTIDKWLDLALEPASEIASTDQFDLALKNRKQRYVLDSTCVFYATDD